MTQRYLLLALLCLAWILPGLIGHDPWKSDEAYTFGVVYDMLQGGSWLVPTLAGEPFLDEPPLYYLTAALTALVASPVLPLHDGARLATGLFMALTLLFCAMAAREASGAISASSASGKDAGMVCALLVLGSFGLLLRGHEIITDSAPLAGYALAYYALVLGLRKPLAAGTIDGPAMTAIKALAARFKGDAMRLEQRRSTWRDVLGRVGCVPVFADLQAGPAAPVLGDLKAALATSAAP